MSNDPVTWALQRAAIMGTEPATGPSSKDLESLAGLEATRVRTGGMLGAAAVDALARHEAARLAAGATNYETDSRAALQRAAAGMAPYLAERQHQFNLAEIGARAKAMDTGAQGLADRNEARNYLHQMLVEDHGVDEMNAQGKPTGTKILAPYAETAMLRVKPQITNIQGVPQILEQLKPELEKGKRLDFYNNPKTMGAARQQVLNQMQLGGQILTPEAVNFIKTGKVDAGNLEMFESAWKKAQGQLKTSAPKSFNATAAAAPEPLEFEPITGTPYGRFTGESKAPPSLADVAIKGVLGTPATWQKAHEREQEARRRWESSLPGRAAGGPVEEERPYLVGEEGPEVFVPEQRGTILPNKPLSLADVAPRQNTPVTRSPNLADLALNELAGRKEGNAKPPDLTAVARAMNPQRDSAVAGAPHILQNPEGATYARTYHPEQGGSMAWDTPVKAPQMISREELLTPENMARANQYLTSVGVSGLLDETFLKSQPDAAAAMIIDALNKSGIRSGGPTFRLAPDQAEAAKVGVEEYASGLRRLNLSDLAPRVSTPTSPTELLRGPDLSMVGRRVLGQGTTTTAPTTEREENLPPLSDLAPRRRRYGGAATTW